MYRYYNIMEVKSDIAAMKDVKCPSCEGAAVYRYGKIKTGSQRFVCLMCGLQFTPDAKKIPVKGKPVCSECGRQMNVYKLEGNVIRFRCSGYPACRTFRKFIMKEER